MKSLIVAFSGIIVPMLLCGQSEWKKIKTVDDITLWTKNAEGSEIKTFRVKVLFKEKMETIVSVLRDVEKMHLWYDRVKSVKKLNEINKNEAVYLLLYELPFPFNNRYSTLKGVLRQSPDKKTTTIETSYFHVGDKEIQKLSPLITKIKSRWEVSENSDGTTQVIHEGFLDPEGNVPLWAINKDVEEAPIKTLKALRKMLPQYRK